MAGDERTNDIGNNNVGDGDHDGGAHTVLMSASFRMPMRSGEKAEKRKTFQTIAERVCVCFFIVNLNIFSFFLILPSAFCYHTASFTEQKEQPCNVSACKAFFLVAVAVLDWM